MTEEQINTLKIRLSDIKNSQGEIKKHLMSETLAYLDGCLSGIK